MPPSPVAAADPPPVVDIAVAAAADPPTVEETVVEVAVAATANPPNVVDGAEVLTLPILEQKSAVSLAAADANESAALGELFASLV